MHIINKIFTKGLLRHACHYMALFPYNLNWAIRLGRAELSYLKKHPLCVADIGARWGAPEELASFFQVMRYHAFDADPIECECLRSKSHPYMDLCVFPKFIGGVVGKVEFHLFKERSQSSVFTPNLRFRDLFMGPTFDVDRTTTIEATTLDAIYADQRNALPDMLKLDTQGSELDLLNAAERVLKTTGLVEVEVEFAEIYKGQPLFHDVSAFMMKHGYELLYMNRHLGQRKMMFGGPTRGQLVFGDALFGKREDCLEYFSVEQLVKYYLLLVNYGHLDVASHIAKVYPVIFDELPAAKRYIRRDSYGSLLKRGLQAQLDKILLMLLRLRRTNPMSMDSDRSWPVM